MKRTFTHLVMTMLLLMISATSMAYDVEVGGIYYNLDKTAKTASVTYKTSSYNSYSGDVTIPETIISGGVTYSVTSIGASAYKGCTDLTSIIIPNSVTSIEDDAFFNCTGITSVIIGNSVNSIGYTSFSQCTKLASVTLPNSVKKIGSQAFCYCPCLKSITIPNSVTYIGSAAFSGCYFTEANFVNNSSLSSSDNWDAIMVEIEQADGLLINGNTIIRCRPNATSVKIPNTVNTLGYCAFNACTGLTSITIPNSVTSIESDAFLYTGLTSVTIPNSVTSIESGTFKNCTSLTSVTIHGSVTSIGSEAFENCTSLATVTIPNSVTSIGVSAFDGCQLRTIIAKQSNPSSEYKDSFSDKTKRHAQLYVPEGSFWTYVYNTSWYSIINIKEFAADEEKVRDGSVYMIADEAGMNYQVYNARTKAISNVEYTFALDEEDEGTCWQVVESGSDKYLYNIGARAYAALNDKGEIELSTTPTALDINMTETGTTINGYNKMLVVNSSVQPSPTTINSITSDNKTTPIFYDLSGRKMTTPQKGLNIVNGKKVIY